MAPPVRVDPKIAKTCRPGLVTAGPLTVSASGAELRERMATAGRELRATHQGMTAGDVERVVTVRAMYRTLGMDPHHTRPSSEALLRRILRGEELPLVNNVVDAANLWSVTTLCPIGLYDAGRISGGIAFRFGADEEGYEGIRKDWVNVSGRPVLADVAGPFGNPTSDSSRTQITGATRLVLAVAFQPVEFPPEEVEQLGQELSSLG